MAWVRVLSLLRTAGPAAAKQLPKLWPLLLEKKNRDRVLEAAADLASQSPKRRLRARIQLTAALAAELAGRSEATSADRRKAHEWARRAQNLSLRLEMPVAGRKQRVEHRRAVRAQLEGLQAEMDTYLGDSRFGGDATDPSDGEPDSD